MLGTDESAREIPLENGGVALVSECDYPLIEGRPCCRIVYRDNKREYALVSGKQMHRVIAEAMGLVGIGRKLHVDHENLNGLDNRRSNLRVATPQQNRANSEKHAAASSGFKGVAWHRGTKKWQSRIKVNGTLIWLGAFSDEEAAAKSYDRAAKHHFGEFAKLNFPE